MRFDPFREVAEQIDLEEALVPASKRNDLLPPRPDDNVGGELGKRFSAELRRALLRGEYAPQPAEFEQVPKPRFTSRPAAVLTLADRCVYFALTAGLLERLEQVLPGETAVFFPRALTASPRWRDFEASPLGGACAYVVKADISGFYGSVAHAKLEEALVRHTGHRELAAALRELLDRVMRDDLGLPQGLQASDPLATGYLATVDWAMLRSGYRYTRHGDDIRIASESYVEARRAIFELERHLAAISLRLNDEKTTIIKAEDYSAQLQVLDKARNELREELREVRVNDLVSGEDTDLEAAMIDLGVDEEVLWGIWYHGAFDQEEIIEILRDRVIPTDVEVAEQLFTRTIANAPGTASPLRREDFHQRLVASLTVLTAARSRAALSAAAQLLMSHPDKTEPLINYLMAVGEVDPAEVVRQVEGALLSGMFQPPWQQAWLLQVLQKHPEFVSAEPLAFAEGLAGSDGAGWLSRVEAIRLLARIGHLTHELAVRSWGASPAVYRPHLIEAAACSDADWVNAFVGSARMDRVYEIVVQRAANQMR